MNMLTSVASPALYRLVPHDRQAGHASLPCSNAAVRVELTQGQYALIDWADAPAVAMHRWHAVRHKDGRFYAATTIRVDGARKRLLLHHLILGPEEEEEIDHISGDGLDCRRGNLRRSTHLQNMANQKTRAHSSRFKGVSWHKRQAQWVSRIRVADRLFNLGSFDDEDAAARAYDAAAKKHFGEFARVNFPC